MLSLPLGYLLYLSPHLYESPNPKFGLITPVVLLEDSWFCSLQIWVCVFLYHPLSPLGMDNGGISFLLL